VSYFIYNVKGTVARDIFDSSFFFKALLSMGPRCRGKKDFDFCFIFYQDILISRGFPAEASAVAVVYSRDFVEL
jgi:hypothetical protein